ncbi:hypothetical protein MRGA423_16015 [Mycobacterium tuberculosis RGTB423]|nr:hypothetical protein MRGA423_16015 [Mycobacterium tuberculosis RGTB423]
MDTDVLDVDTARRRIVDLTDAVRAFCTAHDDGLCNVFVPHATAGVAIIETGAGSDEDLVDTLVRLLPRDDRYRHAHGSYGHGADHLLPAFVAPSVTVPVSGGQPLLGTWQKHRSGRPQPGQSAAVGAIGALWKAERAELGRRTAFS